MTTSVLDHVRASRAEVAEKAKALIAGAEAESRDLNPTEATELRSLNDQLAPFDERIADLTRFAESEIAATREAPKGGARVTNEERTYTSRKSTRGEASFFKDQYLLTYKTDLGARDRMERHMRESMVEGETTEARNGRESRASSGSFAGLVVPQYLTDMAALPLRNGRPFANACDRMPLPDQGMTFQVPRGTTGAATAVQSGENVAVQNQDEVWANVSVPVVTIAGQQQVSRQALERGIPGLDGLIYKDLAGAYAANVDLQALYGTGAGNQMLGALQTSGINAATAYGAAITYALFNSKVAGQLAAVAGAGAQVSPKAIFMHPRRWGWMNSLVDTANRPLVVPLSQAPWNTGALNKMPGGYGAVEDQTSTSGVNVVGSIQGMPIVTDANMPTNVGSATGGEDLLLVADTDQCILFEIGDGTPQLFRFDQTLGNQLTVTLVVYDYIAFTAGRYPAAIGKVGGLDTTTNGQVLPTF